MNHQPSKVEEDLFQPNPTRFHQIDPDPHRFHRHHHHHNHHLDLGPHEAQSRSPILDHQHQHQHHLHQHHQNDDVDVDDDAFALPPDVFFRDEDDDDGSNASSDADNNRNPNNPLPQFAPNDAVGTNPNPNSSIQNVGNNVVNSNKRGLVSTEPHISSQFYTFNKESHALMIQCLREGRLATTVEIRAATPPAVLASWRSVWKDRNEDTAYITAWKRIQDKLNVHVDPTNGNEFLCFKNNSNQFVSHVDQWQDIVMSYHGDADLRHLGLRETIERIKQVWTVGAKFYGIPESYIKTCVAACPVCSDESSGAAPRNKRRRFEYTKSIEVPAKEVLPKLQQLATKHKVVLCIRQKYIRYKPFMAEVKDYACHRAGEPASAKKSKISKREPYASKRCGCGFRIRAIVPITNYNEKDKTFVYQEEGTAVFKLYAVHSGHEPGPLDGSARIMHRIVGHKGGFLMDPDTIYGVREEGENEGFGFSANDDGNLQRSVLQQVQELRNEIGLLEGKLGKIPPELLSSVSRELYDISSKLRNVGEHGSKSVPLISDKQHSDDILIGENDLAEWTGHHQRIYGDGKDSELIEEDENSFGRTLGEVASWEQMRSQCRGEKDLLGETCKGEKWLKCCDFDEKGILNCGGSKLTKSLRFDETSNPDLGLAGSPVEDFYPENPNKWFDCPCDLGSGADCSNVEFGHGEIV